MAQCGNFRIFLLFRFYVKSSFENLEVVKLPFFAFLGALNFHHLLNFSLQKVQKFIQMKFRASKYWQILHFYNPLDWFHVKSEWIFRECEFTDPPLMQICIYFQKLQFWFKNGTSINWYILSRKVLQITNWLETSYQNCFH